MKKTVLIMMISMLLIGVNVYAAGDLQVNGNLGVGTTPTGNKAEIIGTDAAKTLQVTSDYTVGPLPAGNNYSAYYNVNMDATGISGRQTNAFSATLSYTGQGNPFGGMIGADYTLAIKTTEAGVHLINSISGDNIQFRRGTGNDKSVTVTNYSAIASTFNATTGNATGVISGTDWKHISLGAIDNVSVFQPTNMTGIWIDKQIGGTNNYGIVLDGDGVGADIVFGASQQASIYSSAGLLYATDKDGNITQFSPHDPETGEWIYYSKNAKTGVVKRVNMEKLVKAVERITGETFLIETLDGR